ncbi:hypothetical protein [Lacinutrix sp. Hel_I_90]|uniref:hypothetical protein n=1 Tax=Lacinutrix sp. Hel_I_90 TaxID=1249999 RepID=UPI0018CF8438|nr:hypothetical protein [Lacinutrix sp. Hel_I_90]
MTGNSQQTPITIIEKNVHDDAIGLEQYLNPTSDTLFLKSETDILKVTFLNHNEKGSKIIEIGSREVKIPLYHFKTGRYTIAVYTDDKIIAIGANRLSDISLPEADIADLEESILRSSLSEQEQLARNIKPIEKKKQTTQGIPIDNKKSKNAIALENMEWTRIQRNAAKNSKMPPEIENQTTASNKNKEVKEGASNTVKTETYNLSEIPKKNRIRQSRKEYRESHLRPNGTKYDD